MTTAETFRPILHRLLSSLVDAKAVGSVTVDWEPDFDPEGVRCVTWVWNCHVSEVGKIVGTGGKKLRALRLIAQIAGQRAGEKWWVDQPLESPGVREDRSWDQREAPEWHDAEPHREMLADLLGQLGINSEVSVTGDTRNGFYFWLKPAQLMDNMALLDPHEAIFHSEQRNKQPTNLLSCIGLLWHSIGGASIVSYQCDMEYRKPSK